MVDMLGALRHVLEKGIPFAAFRWKGYTRLWATQQFVQTHPAQLGLNSRCFLVRPFDRNGPWGAILDPEVELDLDAQRIDLNGTTPLRGSPIPLTDGPPVAWAREDHLVAVEEAKRRMQDDGLHKVVLARTLSVPFPIQRLPELFIEGLAAHPDAFVCMVNSPFGLWLGASPERLVAAEGGLVAVDAIAGTMPLDAAPKHATGWGAKERVEQEIVTLAVEEAFRELDLRDVTWEGPDVLRAGHLAHLHTRLQARMGGVPLARIVDRLHPTPAVCGTPTEAAIRFIREHEPQDRSLYGGCWGPWEVDGLTEMFVNIRCLRATRDHVHIHVGGGITAASVPEDEWRETELKAQAWLRPIEAVLARIP